MGCPHCRKPGSHFAPPSLGEPGFYTCASREEIIETFRKHDLDVLKHYAPSSPKYQMAQERLAALAEQEAHDE